MGYREIIQSVRNEGRNTLTEYESKKILREFGIPVVSEYFIKDISELRELSHIKFPVVAKGISKSIAHKTEKNLVRLYIKNGDELRREFEELKSVDGVEGVLVSSQITDKREFLLGLKFDQQFGYTVVFGLGGIFTEALKDISIRVCPVSDEDVMEMLSEIRSSKLLGSIRGYPPVNSEKLKEMIISLSKLPEKIPEISEVDINPVMFEDGNPVAVDALVVLKD